jgi:transposase
MASDDDPTQTQQGKSSPFTKMNDGTTHLAYKAEHAVDLDTHIVIAATIHSGDAADGETIKETVIDAQVYLQEATGQGDVIEGIAVDKGYNKTQTLVWAEERGLRTYIPEPEHPHGRRWTDKPATWQAACYGTRRRCARQKGKAL